MKAVLDPEARSAGVLCASGVTVRQAALHCFSSASKSVRSSRMVASHRVSTASVMAWRRYFVTKTEWTCRWWTT